MPGRSKKSKTLPDTPRSKGDVPLKFSCLFLLLLFVFQPFVTFRDARLLLTVTLCEQF